jgi:hypothetical protein
VLALLVAREGPGRPRRLAGAHTARWPAAIGAPL